MSTLMLFSTLSSLNRSSNSSGYKRIIHNSFAIQQSRAHSRERAKVNRTGIRQRLIMRMILARVRHVREIHAHSPRAPTNTRTLARIYMRSARTREIFRGHLQIALIILENVALIVFAQSVGENVSIRQRPSTPTPERTIKPDRMYDKREPLDELVTMA